MIEPERVWEFLKQSAEHLFGGGVPPLADVFGYEEAIRNHQRLGRGTDE